MPEPIMPPEIWLLFEDGQVLTERNNTGYISAFPSEQAAKEHAKALGGMFGTECKPVRYVSPSEKPVALTGSFASGPDSLVRPASTELTSEERRLISEGHITWEKTGFTHETTFKIDPKYYHDEPAIVAAAGMATAGDALGREVEQ